MHTVHLLRDVGVSILGAVLFAFPGNFIGIPLILSYVLAGILLGPHLGFSFITSADSISSVSEIGLILLMFILGLEIDVKKLLQAGKAVAINGILQFLGCLGLGLGVFSLLGYTLSEGRFDLLYLGVACSLSSTLVVVKVLSDRLEMDSLTSRITLGILVFQDLWAIAFLAVQPNLTAVNPEILLQSAGKIAVLVAVATLMARFVLPWVFHQIAKQPELVLVVAMGWCFGICGVAEKLSLSLEMGALVAGVSVASYPYHIDIASKISSLRDFFLTLFFVGLGLQIPVPTPAIMGLAGIIFVFVFVSRLLTIFPTLYFLGYGNRASLIPTLNLSQVSEFSLVLASIGVAMGHISQDLMSAIVIAMILTILISSFLIPNTQKVYEKIDPILKKIGLRDRITSLKKESETEAESHAHRIVFLGFHRTASSLLEEILKRRSEEFKKEILVIDFNPESHRALKHRKIACKYGDIGHMETLRNIGLDKAQLIVSTISDHYLKGTSNLKVLQNLKKVAPQAKTIMTAESKESALDLYQHGATYVVLPRKITSYYLADILEAMESNRTDVIRNASIKNLEDSNEVIS